jgi:hypothetical protein
MGILDSRDEQPPRRVQNARAGIHKFTNIGVAADGGDFSRTRGDGSSEHSIDGIEDPCIAHDQFGGRWNVGHSIAPEVDGAGSPDGEQKYERDPQNK